MSELNREEILTINQKGWNEVVPMFYGGTALPKYGPLVATEDEIVYLSQCSYQIWLGAGAVGGK